MPVIEFEAQPYTIGSWTILHLPQSASQKLPSRGQVMVKGTLSGVSFQTALEPDGKTGHWLHIDKKLQKAANIKPGDTVDLAIESTKDWPEPDIPADILAALKSHPQEHGLWGTFTPMARWEWIRWINSTGQQETRKRRIEVSLSKMRGGERRPCCFNRNMCCVPEVSKNGVLLEPANV